MATRGRPPSSKTLVDRQLGRNIKHPILPAGADFVIPNLSGDHSAGRVDSTPTKDSDIANKKYVDDAVAGGGVSFDVNTISVLDGAVLTLDGNVLILQ